MLRTHWIYFLQRCSTLSPYQPYYLTSQQLHPDQILMVKIPPYRQHLQRHGLITQSHSQHFKH